MWAKPEKSHLFKNTSEETEINMKAVKLKASQRSVKIKIKLIFILIQLSEMHGAGNVKI